MALDTVKAVGKKGRIYVCTACNRAWRTAGANQATANRIRSEALQHVKQCGKGV